MTHVGRALLLGFAVLCSPLVAEAQQATRVWRMGVLTGDRPGAVETLVEALRELGYVEGRSLIVERRRFTRDDDLRKFAAELVALNPDVIVVGHGAAALVLKSITTTVPVVMASSNDALAQGVVTSLARPGGNITGLTNMASDVVSKRLEILKEAAPKASRIAVLGCPRGAEKGPARGEAAAMREAAQARGLTIVPIFIEEPTDLAKAFDAALPQKFDAVLLLECSLYPRPELLAAMVNKARVPAMYPSTRWAQGGGLMAYGPNGLEQYRRAAVFVDKIFKGAKPGDLPIEQPTKFELVINLKTAKAQGLTIPKSLLVRADQVIE